MQAVAIVEANAVEAKKDEAVSLYLSGDCEGARELIFEALIENTDADLELNLACNWSAAERGLGNTLTALSILKLVSHLAKSTSSYRLKGYYDNGLALSYRRLGRIHDAYEAYKRAAKHFESGGLWSDLKAVENNIAFLLIQTGHAADAIERLKRIKHQFEMLHQFERAAEVQDTLQQAYQAMEGKQ